MQKLELQPAINKSAVSHLDRCYVYNEETMTIIEGASNDCVASSRAIALNNNELSNDREIIYRWAYKNEVTVI